MKNSSDVFGRLAAEGKLPEFPSLEDFQALAFEDPAFPAMDEEDQILYLQRKRIDIGYKTIGKAARELKTREAYARELLLTHLGSKYAERVLADPVCRQKLGID